MGRLIDVEELSVSQKVIRDRIFNGVGECACGRTLTQLSPKFILGNIFSAQPGHEVEKFRRDGIIMAAYCLECSTRINNLLKAIKERGQQWLR